MFNNNNNLGLNHRNGTLDNAELGHPLCRLWMRRIDTACMAKSSSRDTGVRQKGKMTPLKDRFFMISLVNVNDLCCMAKHVTIHTLKKAYAHP